MEEVKCNDKHIEELKQSAITDENITKHLGVLE
jgi:hypothetical protein